MPNDGPDRAGGAVQNRVENFCRRDTAKTAFTVKSGRGRLLGGGKARRIRAAMLCLARPSTTFSKSGMNSLPNFPLTPTSSKETSTLSISQAKGEAKGFSGSLHPMASDDVSGA
jgi:hypothetical protein